jgi:hypothetical protein
MHCETICLENTSGELTRWLRVVNEHDQYVCIETNNYAKLKQGYAMHFCNWHEFDQWLEEQKSTGWSVTFMGPETLADLDPATLDRLYQKVFRTLSDQSLT